MEWMSHALLMVDAVDAGNLVEVTVFARPAVQRQVKSVLLSQASVHREQRARGEGLGKHAWEEGRGRGTNPGRWDRGGGGRQETHWGRT